MITLPRTLTPQSFDPNPGSTSEAAQKGILIGWSGVAPQ